MRLHGEYFSKDRVAYFGPKLEMNKERFSLYEWKGGFSFRRVEGWIFFEKCKLIFGSMTVLQDSIDV